MKTCNRCKQTKELKDFDRNSREKDGYGATCKVCKKEDYLKRKNKNPIQTYFIAKRSECKQKGFAFDLDLDYLVSIWTPECPVFGTPMKIGTGGRGDGYNSHLDRIDPALGYVKGNVAWISGRANRIKYNASSEELRKIADWMERATTISKESTLK
jgi:hypothetical protein